MLANGYRRPDARELTASLSDHFLTKTLGLPCLTTGNDNAGWRQRRAQVQTWDFGPSAVTGRGGRNSILSPFLPLPPSPLHLSHSVQHGLEIVSQTWRLLIAPSTPTSLGLRPFSNTLDYLSWLQRE